jgi:hypothetical protein
MSITWTIDNDSRQNLGPSGELVQARASFSASDYATGGYAVYPANFGLSSIRGLFAVGFSSIASGTPGGYDWAAVEPTTKGPAASNPWYLKSLSQNSTTGPLVETASNTNFASGTMDLVAFGY